MLKRSIFPRGGRQAVPPRSGPMQPHCHCCMLLMMARMLIFSWAESTSSFCFWATPVPKPYSRPQYLASSILSSKNNCRTGQRTHGENDAKSHAKNHATSPHYHISTSQLSQSPENLANQKLIPERKAPNLCVLLSEQMSTFQEFFYCQDPCAADTTAAAPAI